MTTAPAPGRACMPHTPHVVFTSAQPLIGHEQRSDWTAIAGWLLIVVAMALTAFLPPALAQPAVSGLDSVVLEGKTARVVIHLKGGVISEFRLRDDPLNPLQGLG